MSSEYLLEVKNLKKEFPITGGLFGKEVGTVKAVNNINFKIKRGETLGLVGESGCGKTTLGRTILQLIPETTGEIYFDGECISSMKRRKLQQVRRKMQIIFQDPCASLNPRMTIKYILNEPMDIHGLNTDKHVRRKRLLELLDQVQLSRDSLNKYPHEFSGGQRQRICIARALAVEPEFIVCDEPVSALDVSVQAQVVNLLMELQKELQLTYLFISHDLKIVEYVSSRVAVMYLGNIVEIAKASELYGQTRHPYTKALFSAIPAACPVTRMDRMILKGDIPSPINPPRGCHFHPRCFNILDRCRMEYPPLSSDSNTHQYCCFNPVGK